MQLLIREIQYALWTEADFMPCMSLFTLYKKMNVILLERFTIRIVLEIWGTTITGFYAFICIVPYLGMRKAGQMGRDQQFQQYSCLGHISGSRRSSSHQEQSGRCFWKDSDSLMDGLSRSLHDCSVWSLWTLANWWKQKTIHKVYLT